MVGADGVIIPDQWHPVVSFLIPNPHETITAVVGIQSIERDRFSEIVFDNTLRLLTDEFT